MTTQHDYSLSHGGHISYLSAGQGDLILLLHGFPEYNGIWQKQLTYFADHGFHAVAPDLPGYNQSYKPETLEQYKLSNIIADLVEFMRSFASNRVIVVGHDWGGSVAQGIAARCPDQVTQLILLNTTHPQGFAKLLLSCPEQLEASQYINAFRQPGAEMSLLSHNYKDLLAIFSNHHANWQLDETEQNAYRAVWQQPRAIESALNYYRASFCYPPTDEASQQILHAFANSPEAPYTLPKTPTLLLWGEQDAYLVNDNVQQFEHYCHQLSVIRFAEGSHWLLHEFPDEINQHIRDFITDS